MDISTCDKRLIEPFLIAVEACKESPRSCPDCCQEGGGYCQGETTSDTETPIHPESKSEGAVAQEQKGVTKQKPKQ